jgi:hypothetical protein
MLGAPDRTRPGAVDRRSHSSSARQCAAGSRGGADVAIGISTAGDLGWSGAGWARHRTGGRAVGRYEEMQASGGREDAALLEVMDVTRHEAAETPAWGRHVTRDRWMIRYRA